MVDIILWSAGGLAAATVGLTLYGVGMAHRFKRLTAMREALEARCANLQNEVEARKALEQERAKVQAERVVLQETQSSLQRELDHVRENAERKATILAESLVVRHTLNAKKAEQEALALKAMVEAAFKKTTEPRWGLSRSFKYILPKIKWKGTHEMAEAHLKHLWGENPKVIVRLVSSSTGWVDQVRNGTFHFEGQSMEEWHAYRKEYDGYSYRESYAYFTLFQRE